MTTGSRLKGLRILVTRPEGKVSDLGRRLTDLGAHVVEEPLTRTRALDVREYALLDRALERLSDYDWVLFTSDEGVRYCLARAAGRGRSTDMGSLFPKGVRVAVIGPATALALKTEGRVPDLVASDHRAEGLVEALQSLGETVRGKRFLLVRAEKGRDVLRRDLAQAGAHVEVVPAYKTEGIPDGAARAAARLKRNEVDVVLATSGAALDELASAIACLPDVRAGIRIAALGPVTAAHAKKLGFEVSVTAGSATIDGLIDALLKTFGKET